jgi:HSP20 family molecular chaperone IbpA
MNEQETPAVRRAEQTRYFQPATDIAETEEAVVLTLDMPGVAKEDVDVTVDKDMLTIIGRAHPEETGEPVYRETYVGDYRRQFTLTADVDAQDVSASMSDGVLTLRVGKAKEAKPRKIQIAAK